MKLDVFLGRLFARQIGEDPGAAIGMLVDEMEKVNNAIVAALRSFRTVPPGERLAAWEKIGADLLGLNVLQRAGAQLLLGGAVGDIELEIEFRQTTPLPADGDVTLAKKKRSRRSRQKAGPTTASDLPPQIVGKKIRYLLKSKVKGIGAVVKALKKAKINTVGTLFEVWNTGEDVLRKTANIRQASIEKLKAALVALGLPLPGGSTITILAAVEEKAE